MTTDATGRHRVAPDAPGTPVTGAQYGTPATGAHRRAAPRRPDAEAVALVQAGLAVVAHRPTALTEAFYEHLFALAPQTRSMFPADMRVQNDRLCRALIDAVTALTGPRHEAAEMERRLRTLGVRHDHHYGVSPRHYPYVGHALVRAVSEVTGDWSSRTSSAWIWVYDWMSTHMLGRAD